MSEVPVLIVGGGPVGLSASILLSQLGIRSLLVERHPGTSIVPKARGINARTMEVYRQHGVEKNIRAAGLAPQKAGQILWTESLAGKELERRTPGRLNPKNQAMAPVPNCLCAQDDLEPVLRRFAEVQPLTELRFNVEMIETRIEAGGINVVLTDRTTGATTPIHAEYLIAADGAQSRIRRTLDVKMVGEQNVYDSVNILFNADLTPWTAYRPGALYFVEQPDLRATFLTINAVDRWSFLIHSLSHYGYTPADFTDEKCIALIRQGVGCADLPVKILGISAWEASAHVAAQYRHGRVFLAGDAAHEMPPTGGFGLNTGVQDVHNLAWKLAAVLHGQAADSLLDTYHPERQPLGQLITKTSLENSLSMGRTERQETAKIARPEFLSEQGLIFGANYASTAVIPDGTPTAVNDNPITRYLPSARPGCRAPHVALLWDQRATISTIDLFGPFFVLLAGAKGHAWRDAARAVVVPSRPPVKAYMIGGNLELTDPKGDWLELYGLDVDGAVLVRPDGVVAWRSRSGVEDALRVLAAVFDRLLGHAT